MLVQLEQIRAHPLVQPLGGPLRPAEGEAGDPAPGRPIRPREQERQPAPHAAMGREELVLQRHDRLVAPRIALAPAAAEELAVDAARLVALGGDHVQAPVRGHSRSQADVGPAPGHVGGDGHPSLPPGLGDDLGLLAVLAGVEHPVRKGRLREKPAHVLGSSHGARAQQDGATAPVDGAHALDHRLPPPRRRPVHAVGPRAAIQRPVGRHGHDGEPVHAPQLARHLPRRARHPREPEVAAEEALVADARQRVVAAGDGAVLLDLDELVQPLLPRAVRHEAPRELVDDLDPAVADKVMPVALEEMAGHERLARELLAAQPAAPHSAQRLGEVAEPRLAGLGEPDAALPRLDDEVAPGREGRRERERALVHATLAGVLGGALAAPGDDQRGARLVDEDAVGLVHDGVVQAAQQEPPRPRPLAGEALDLELDAVRLASEHEPVAEVVEGELLVRAVGHVAAIRGPPLLRLHPVHDDAHGEPQRAVDRSHPVGIPRGEVVVHRHDVDRDPRQRRRGRRQGRREGLALSGLHLGHEPRQQDPSAQELHVVVALPQRAGGRLANEGEGPRHRLIGKALTPERLAEIGGGLAQPPLPEPGHGRAVGGRQRELALAASGPRPEAPQDGPRDARAEPVERPRAAAIEALGVGAGGHLEGERGARH